MKKLFIVHGWTYDTEKWEPFLKQLKVFGIQGVILNVPGLTGAIKNSWDINNYVEWLHEKLADESEINLLGHSNGGRIILSYVLKYPKRIRKIVLVDSAGIYHNEIPIRTKRIIFRYISKIGKIFTNSNIIKNIFYKLIGENDYNNSTEVMKATMNNLIKVDLAPHLRKIKIPTAIIWGEDDQSIPLMDAYLFNKKIKNSTLFIVKKARHSPQFTNTFQVVKIIDEHI